MNEIDKLARATKKSFDYIGKQIKSVRSDIIDMGQEIKASKSELKQDISELRQEINDSKSEVRQEMKETKDEILREFHVVAENIHQDVAVANKDEILLIKQKQEQHERRISRVEEKVGV